MWHAIFIFPKMADLRAFQLLSKLMVQKVALIQHILELWPPNDLTNVTFLSSTK